MTPGTSLVTTKKKKKDDQPLWLTKCFQAIGEADGGDKQDAVAILLEEAEADPVLRQDLLLFAVETRLEEALAIMRARKSERDREVQREIAQGEQKRGMDKVRRVVTAESTGILDRVIPGGKRLRYANYGDLINASKYAARRAEEMRERGAEYDAEAAFYVALAKGLTGGKLVEQAYSAREAEKMEEKAKHSA